MTADGRRLARPGLAPWLNWSSARQGQWAFAPINVLTQGNPNNSTSNVLYVLYQIAFQYFNVGQAAAASVLVFLVMGAGIVVGARLLDKRSHFDN